MAQMPRISIETTPGKPHTGGKTRKVAHKSPAKAHTGGSTQKVEPKGAQKPSTAGKTPKVSYGKAGNPNTGGTTGKVTHVPASTASTGGSTRMAMKGAPGKMLSRTDGTKSVDTSKAQAYPYGKTKKAVSSKGIKGKGMAC